MKKTVQKEFNDPWVLGLEVFSNTKMNIYTSSQPKVFNLPYFINEVIKKLILKGNFFDFTKLLFGFHYRVQLKFKNKDKEKTLLPVLVSMWNTAESFCNFIALDKILI